MCIYLAGSKSEDGELNNTVWVAKSNLTQLLETNAKSNPLSETNAQNNPQSETNAQNNPHC
jgi:hypothetical protein